MRNAKTSINHLSFSPETKNTAVSRNPANPVSAAVQLRPLPTAPAREPQVQGLLFQMWRERDWVFI